MTRCTVRNLADLRRALRRLDGVDDDTPVTRTTIIFTLDVEHGSHVTITPNPGSDHDHDHAHGR